MQKGREENRIGERDKLCCIAFSKEDSAHPTVSSETSMTLQSCPKLGKWGVGLYVLCSKECNFIQREIVPLPSAPVMSSLSPWNVLPEKKCLCLPRDIGPLHNLTI